MYTALESRRIATEEDDMVRWILILGLALGFSLRDYQLDRTADPDVQVMDGSDPFPPW
jgi:hypothetical protein